VHNARGPNLLALVPLSAIFLPAWHNKQTSCFPPPLPMAIQALRLSHAPQGSQLLTIPFPFFFFAARMTKARFAAARIFFCPMTASNESRFIEPLAGETVSPGSQVREP